MYVSERERSESRSAISLEQWLGQLEIVATCEQLGESNLARAAQLLNKTNQMNMATRRLSEGELMAWSARPGHSMWTFRVADRYGDLGITGLLGLRVQDGNAEVVDFLLSCRAMGRKIEETMIAVAVAHARSSGAASIVARFLPTAKNRPCLEFWENSDWGRIEDGLFSWELSKPYPVPEHVRLEGVGSLVQTPA
jgi:FkbH-like protein